MNIVQKSFLTEVILFFLGLLRDNGILEDVNQVESRHSRSAESLSLRQTTNDQSFSSNVDRLNTNDKRRSSKYDIQPVSSS